MVGPVLDELGRPILAVNDPNADVFRPQKRFVWEIHDEPRDRHALLFEQSDEAALRGDDFVDARIGVGEVLGDGHLLFS